MDRTPKVHEYMSLVPRTIDEEMTISRAGTVMRQHDIRHLPVLKDGSLVGIVSDRDIRIAESLPGPAELPVKDLMTRDPFVVSPDTFLDEVVSRMVEHKYGCAVVQEPGGEIVGIFTTIDALRVLRDSFQRYCTHVAA